MSDDGKTWLEMLSEMPILDISTLDARLRRRLFNCGFPNLPSVLRCSDAQLGDLLSEDDINVIKTLKIRFRANPEIFSRSMLSSSRLANNDETLPSRAAQDEGKSDDVEELSDKEESDWVVEELMGLGLEYVDQRPKGGALWVLSSPLAKRGIDSLATMGADFKFCLGGGKSTDYQDGWWLDEYPEKLHSDGQVKTNSDWDVTASLDGIADVDAGNKDLYKEILKVLVQEEIPCTPGYIAFELTQYDFDEISEAIDELLMTGILCESADGVEIASANSQLVVPEEEESLVSTDERVFASALDFEVGKPEFIDGDVVAELSWNAHVRSSDDIEILDLPARIVSTLEANGIVSVADLVRRLDGGIHGLGEKGQETIFRILSERAYSLLGESRRCAQSLGSLAGSEDFCFDLFDVLCRTDGLLNESGGVQKPAIEEQAVIGALLKKKYPLNQESFKAVWPLIARRYNAEAELDVSSVVAYLENEESLLRACRAALCKQLREQALAVLRGVSAESIPIAQSSGWLIAAQEIARERQWCTFNKKRKTLRIEYPTVETWLSTFGFKESQMYKNQLRDKGAERKAFGPSSYTQNEQRAFAEAMKTRPLFFEDAFRYLFSNYKLSMNQFLDLTCSSRYGYYYLRAFPCKDAKPVTSVLLAASDERVPEPVRQRIRLLRDLGSIELPEGRTELSYASLSRVVLMRHASSECISWAFLHEKYQELLSELNLPADISHLEIPSRREYQAELEKYNDVLILPRSETDAIIRYYNIAGKRFAHLTTIFTNAKRKACECSIALLYYDPDNAELMEAFDIHNEYELFAVVKKHCKKAKGWTLGKCPMVTIGTASRDNQVLRLIKEMSPVKETDLAAEYERRYGVKQTTFRNGGFLKPFKAYLYNGKYVYSNDRLSQSQIEFLKKHLTENYHSLSMIRTWFADEFPKASEVAINSESVKPLGYRVSEGLLIKADLDEKAVFGNLLDGRDSFTVYDEGFGEEVFAHHDFSAELSKRLRSYKLLEWEKGAFISSRKLYSSLGGRYRKGDLRSYTEKAFSFAAPGEAFTLTSLRKKGFSHKLDGLREELGFGDYFYESLLVLGKKDLMKSTTYGDCSVFCEMHGAFSSVDLLEEIVGKEKAMELDDLIDYLADEYGITVASNSLKQTIQNRTNLYYVSAMEMVFDSQDAFSEYAAELLG